ncbi:MAG TPA: hypothetical protein VN666_21810 [Nitrospira sp.]|nr:hypothetical protein [Nitrospira sp.]
MSHDLFLGTTDEILRDILHELRQIRRKLEPRFTLRIQQKECTVVEWGDGNKSEFWSVKTMPAITAGSSGTFFLSATASDNSTPVLSAQTLTADDTNVTIAHDTSDTSGNTFTVTVPASDTATTFNLSASASVTSNTSSTPQTVTASLAVTISPIPSACSGSIAATVPVTFTLSIGEK